MPTKRLQYQVRTEPVNAAGFPEQKLESRWHEPFSEPVRQRIRPGLAIALIASGLTFVVDARTAPANATPDRWMRPFSEPVRTKPALPASEQSFFTIGQPPIVASVSGWYQRFLEPVRVKPGLSAGAQQSFAFNPLPVTVATYGWNQPLSLPAKPKPGLHASQQDIEADNYQPFVSFSWFSGLSEPVRIKRGLLAGQQQFLAKNTNPPDVIDSNRWFNWLSDPTRIKQGFSASGQSFVASEQLPIVSFGWEGRFSEPVKQKLGLRVSLQQSFAGSNFTPPSEIITVDKWFEPFSERLYSKRGLAQYLQLRSEAYTPPADTIFPDRWWRQFDPPPKPKAGLPARSQQVLAWGVVTPTPPVPAPAESWFAPFSDPIRIKLGLKAPAQAFFASEHLPITVSIGWYSPLSLPTPPKKILPVQHQQAWAGPVFMPPFTAGAAWSIGPTFKYEVQYQAYAKVAYVARDIFSTGSWFIPLSEPKRFKPALHAALHPFLAFAPQPVTEALKVFYPPWSEPKRFKPDLKTGLQQTLAYGYFWPRPTDSEAASGAGPVFTRSVQYQALAKVPFTPPTIINVDEWFIHLSEPKRFKRSTAEFPQPAFTTITFTPSVAGWVTALSEPVRVKPSLKTSNQSFFTTTYAPTPIPPASGWFERFGEPVRSKPGLSAARQPFQSFYPFPAPGAHHTMTMAVTSPADVFLGLLSDYKTVASAYVSIKDIGRKAAYVAIVETGHKQAYVAIHEEGTTSAYTSIVIPAGAVPPVPPIPPIPPIPPEATLVSKWYNNFAHLPNGNVLPVAVVAPVVSPLPIPPVYDGNVGRWYSNFTKPFFGHPPLVPHISVVAPVLPIDEPSVNKWSAPNNYIRAAFGVPMTVYIPPTILPPPGGVFIPVYDQEPPPQRSEMQYQSLATCPSTLA